MLRRRAAQSLLIGAGVLGLARPIYGSPVPAPTPAPAPLSPEQLHALHRRGGVAAGDPDKNPTETSYATSPPKSTYGGPTVAGSEGGFIGLVAGLAALVLLSAGIAWFFIRRRRRAQGRSNLVPASLRDLPFVPGGKAQSRRGNKAAGKHEELGSDDEDDTFEMGNQRGHQAHLKRAAANNPSELDLQGGANGHAGAGRREDDPWASSVSLSLGTAGYEDDEKDARFGRAGYGESVESVDFAHRQSLEGGHVYNQVQSDDGSRTPISSAPKASSNITS
ncbi:uncharacterized protein L969DRAFT_573942 [Mixia osmundae IAM 14324]|uniref:Gram-positive cocci surface proteins LPxTG domain-containing protein n=1 Tax=Mixia osmundae (strain CBS 9802 / IAM 14324 / JCM 22182 / KY 12970) TaxID=764103 RepID=G7DS47_MIXOS|nr:uncharacterized protein L969DRAFT_573942 [Mixia osmundae IAM 14324]KEI37538.1 hypothetical protein L969DRAFT_573942 [Mixia osmundae IAM 14324]GAA93407.1 hypothetical protein E5Q_00048 [Mixia osmundae IAM 14324]